MGKSVPVSKDCARASRRFKIYRPGGTPTDSLKIFVSFILEIFNVLQIELKDPNFDFDLLKTFLEDHRPDVDDAGCRVAIKVMNKGLMASFVLSKDWEVYLDQTLLDTLREIPGITYHLVDKKTQ